MSETGTSKRSESRPSRYLIYGLVDPRDGCLCYVGKTHKRRELRLAEHVEHAIEGSRLPVHAWIRELLEADLQPEVFVLRRVPGDLSWQQAEKEVIDMWRAWPATALPYVHSPQTKKSKPVTISKVNLRNIRAGG